MNFIIELVELIGAGFDVLAAIPFFGPALVIGTTAAMIAAAIKS